MFIALRVFWGGSIGIKSLNSHLKIFIFLNANVTERGCVKESSLLWPNPKKAALTRVWSSLSQKTGAPPGFPTWVHAPKYI